MRYTPALGTRLECTSDSRPKKKLSIEEHIETTFGSFLERYVLSTLVISSVPHSAKSGSFATVFLRDIKQERDERDNERNRKERDVMGKQ